MAQGIMSDKFLMPALENISVKYKLSATVAGLLIAFGIAVPELAVTMLSFQRHGVQMTEFGLANVFGSVAFCVTFVPAIAYLVNYGLFKAKPELTEAEVKKNESLMVAFLRDMSFLILGEVLFYFFMEIQSLTVGNCIILLALFAVYIAIICTQQWYQQKKE